MTMEGKKTTRNDANLSNLIYQKHCREREEKLNPGDAINDQSKLPLLMGIISNVRRNFCHGVRC